GLAALIATGHPLQLGLIDANRVPDYWGGGGRLCVDLLLERPPGVTWADETYLLGMRSKTTGGPASWRITVKSYGFCLDVFCAEPAYAATGAFHRLNLACDPTAASRWRLRWQADFGTGQMEGSINGTVSALTAVSGYPAAGQESIAGQAMTPCDGVRPFGIGYL